MSTISKEKVVYTCPFIPSEWIASHGFDPMRILPRSPEKGSTTWQGMCPFTRAYIHSLTQVKEAAASVFTTTCDQMRRASEMTPSLTKIPYFLFNMPSTWETPVARKMYRQSLERLGRFLQKLGGRAPKPKQLAEVMKNYDNIRNDLRAARSKFTARDFSRALAEFHRSGIVTWNRYKGAEAPRGKALALVGGPILENHFDLFDVIEQAGGRVVLDATTSGERTLPAPFNPETINDDPFATLIESYFGSIPDAFQRPNRPLYSWLKDKIHHRKACGILFWQYTWCDTWRGELQRMREWTRLPILSIDMADDYAVSARTVSKIESFLEILE